MVPVPPVVPVPPRPRWRRWTVPPVVVGAGACVVVWPVVVRPPGWPWVWVWSVDVVSVWSVEVLELGVLEVPVEVWASASAPGAGVSSGSDAGTASWEASSLPQALRPRHATARRTTTYVRM